MEAGPGGISGTGCAARAARLSPHTRPALPAECLRGDGASYRGSRSVASGGAPCLNWGLAVRSGPGAELPAGGCEGSAFCCVFFFFSLWGEGSGRRGPRADGPVPPAAAEDHNSCRNPDGAAAPWCYVRGADGVPERRPCDIAPCPGRSTPSLSFPSLLPSPGLCFSRPAAGVGVCHQGGWGPPPAHGQPQLRQPPLPFSGNRVYPGLPSGPCLHICLPAAPCSTPRAFVLAPENACAKLCPCTYFASRYGAVGSCCKRLRSGHLGTTETWVEHYRGACYSCLNKYAAAK